MSNQLGHVEIESETSWPFASLQLLKPNIFQKILGREPMGNGFIRANNLLAGVRSVSALSQNDFREIERTTRIVLFRDFPTEISALLEKYVLYTLDGRATSQDVASLCRLLGIPPESAQEIASKAKITRSTQLIQRVVSAGSIDEGGHRVLEAVKSLVGPDVANTLYQSCALDRCQAVLKRILSEDECSPEDDAELQRVQQNLGVTIEFEPFEKDLKSRRLNYFIAHGDLPTVEVPINLQRNESCYLKTSAEWHEIRKRTTRINYSGPVASVRIAKGVRWRMGSVGVRTHSENVLTKIDAGTVYLTNKRLIFTGAQKNSTRPLSGILEFTPYRDGIEIHKGSGRNPFLMMSNGVEYFARVLARLIREAR